MVAVRFKGLDLNLLVAFDTLLETRSVSRAAERMNLSQPAMSAALGRLRRFFGDDILTPRGKRMFPTPFAESLLPQIRLSLRGLEDLLATSAVFDPATSHRAFRIVASDYIMASMLVPLISRLTVVAPHVRIEIIQPGEEATKQLEEGKVDLSITPDSFMAPGHPSELLFEERHLVVGWDQNPLFKGKLTKEAFFASGHVSVAFGARASPSFADRHLEVAAQPRRVEVVASSFTAVPWLVKDTLRLALVHERLVHAMSVYFPIAHADVPFDFPIMREMIQFHESRANEPGVAWLREQLHDLALCS
jgi:LysR family nod box-dependent transcriptional activator